MKPVRNVLQEIDVELAQITTKYSENVLDSTNAFEMVINDEKLAWQVAADRHRSGPGKRQDRRTWKAGDSRCRLQATPR